MPLPSPLSPPPAAARFPTRSARRLMGSLTLLALCSLAAAVPAAAGIPEAVGALLADVVLDIRRHPADQTDWQTLSRNLVRLKSGDRLTAAGVEEALAALEASNRFEKIHADTVDTPAGPVLTFTLTPFRRIKVIHIQNAAPLFTRDIRNRMSIHAGGQFPEGSLATQAAAVEALYREEGFVAPRVEAEARLDPADGLYTIRFVVHKGVWQRLGNLSFQGNHAFSADRLKLRMRVWRAGLLVGSASRFIEKNLTADVQRLTAFYRARGFVDCRITPLLTRDAAGGVVDVLMNVDEGPRYRVEFDGNQAFGDRTLRKDLVLFEEGNRTNRGVRKTIRNIRQRYHQAGYGDVRVKTEQTTESRDGQPVEHLVFHILEGPRTVVSEITINGSRALPEEAILRQMDSRAKKPFVPDALENDIAALTERFRRLGFSEIAVAPQLDFSPDRQSAAITLAVVEGPQQRVSEVEITGIDAPTVAQARSAIALQPGEPFRRYMLQSDENTLAALISEKGFPHVTVVGSATPDPDPTELKLRYAVEPGPAVVNGHIHYAGNLRTRPEILDREAGLQPGAPFSLKQATTAQRNLRNVDVFNSVQFTTIGLREKWEEVEFFADLEEKKPYFFELGGGYQSDSGLFAGTRLGDQNLFGMNRRLTLGGQVSETGYRTELELQDPNLWSTGTSAALSLFIERIEEFNTNFETRAYGAVLGLSRKWFENWRTGIGTRLERREQLATGSGEISDTDVELGRRTLIVTTPSLQYDSRDSFIRPRKGLFMNLAVDISKGVENPEDDFLKYRGEGRAFWSPLTRLTLAGTTRLGYITPYGDSRDVPQDQLFFLGGIADVRGFEENLLRFDANGDAVGGRSSLSGSLEARIDLGLDFELTLFYDIGRLSDSVGAVGDYDWRDSVGAGLRYITPIGPIGILYGHKLDRRSGESAGQFHFAIGYSF
ncbi:MAG: POTRA domain-containing protein [Desulfobacterales bacterium]